MATALSGELMSVFGIAVLDAVLLSWIVLRWYALSVARLMSQTGAAPAQMQGAAMRVPADAPSSARPPDVVPGRRDRRRLTLAYIVGAVAHASVMTALLTPWSDSTPVLTEWLAQFWTNLWPLVPTLIAVLALDRARAVRLAVSFVLAGVVVVALVHLLVQISRGSINAAPIRDLYLLPLALAWVAGPPAILVLATSWRRVRGVSPLALAATLVFGFALILVKNGFVQALDVESIHAAVLKTYGAVPGLARLGYYPLFMLAALPVGWIAWLLLRAMARGFKYKQFSDIQLVVDCWWIVVTTFDIAMLAGGRSALLATIEGVIAFIAYRAAVEVVLRATPRRQLAPRRLLVLRVFGYRARTESLFDRIAQRWRFHGPVQLIAGPDLAMRTATPGDVLSFIQGQLANQYIASDERIAPRVRALDVLPDPDGRFRVEELFCRENSWRSVLQALIRVSDLVLMDLRSFSVSNSGCIFELEQLVQSPLGDRVILICDHSTDVKFLQLTLDAALEKAQHGDSTHGAGRPTLVHIERNAPREINLLMERMVHSDIEGPHPPDLQGMPVPFQ